MTKANGHDRLSTRMQGAAGAALAAAALILLGVVFQLGELGYGHLRSEDFWLFSVLLASFWNMLAMRLNVPVMHEVMRCWPLILVCTGIAILLLSRRMMNSEEPHGAGAGDSDGR
jgi:hypothetical protein